MVVCHSFMTMVIGSGFFLEFRDLFTREFFSDELAERFRFFQAVRRRRKIRDRMIGTVFGLPLSEPIPLNAAFNDFKQHIHVAQVVLDRHGKVGDIRVLGVFR